jgi:hypothetical protein
MPPKCSFLSFNSKPVGVTSTWSNWALCHKFWPICPTRSHLPNTVPAQKKMPHAPYKDLSRTYIYIYIYIYEQSGKVERHECY